MSLVSLFLYSWTNLVNLDTIKVHLRLSVTQVFFSPSCQCWLSFNCPLPPSLFLSLSLSFSVSVCVSQIQSLVTDSAGHKLLVLSGQSSDHGGLLLQTGVFTYQTFSRVFADPGVSQIYCPLTLEHIQECTVYIFQQIFKCSWKMGGCFGTFWYCICCKAQIAQHLWKNTQGWVFSPY